MPWRITSPMYERHRFVLDAEHTPAAFAELCRRYVISRKAGYKWLDRYGRLGPESLADRSHRPAAWPHATAPAVVREILQLRRAALYTPSDRLYVPQLRPIAYPEHFEVRRVSTNGGIRWQKRWVNVSHILATLPVGLEPLATGTWNLFFGPVHLGWLDERDYRIHDHRGRLKREHHLSPIR